MTGIAEVLYHSLSFQVTLGKEAGQDTVVASILSWTVKGEIIVAHPIH